MRRARWRAWLRWLPYRPRARVKCAAAHDAARADARPTTSTTKVCSPVLASSQLTITATAMSQPDRRDLRLYRVDYAHGGRLHYGSGAVGIVEPNARQWHVDEREPSEIRS